MNSEAPPLRKCSFHLAHLIPDSPSFPRTRTQLCQIIEALGFTEKSLRVQVRIVTQDAEQRRDQDHVVTVLQMTDLYRQVVPVLVGLGAVVLLHPCQLPGLHLLGVVGLEVVEEPRQLRVGGLPLVGGDLLQLECTYVLSLVRC